MKIFFAFLLLIPAAVGAQESVAEELTKFRFAVTYGLTMINPELINSRIAASNAVFGSTTKSFKSIPELAATVTLRPVEDLRVIILRAGYISSSREFPFTIPESNNGTTTGAVTTGTITETYSAYPISIGIGATNPKQDLIAQLELIYGLGYVLEEGAYTSSTGQKTSYERTVFSPTYGFRVSGAVISPISSMVGLRIEVAYRYLHFDEFENEATAQPSTIEFSMSGVQFNAGLHFTL